MSSLTLCLLVISSSAHLTIHSNIFNKLLHTTVDGVHADPRHSRSVMHTPHSRRVPNRNVPGISFKARLFNLDSTCKLKRVNSLTKQEDKVLPCIMFTVQINAHQIWQFRCTQRPGTGFPSPRRALCLHVICRNELHGCDVKVRSLYSYQQKLTHTRQCTFRKILLIWYKSTILF